MNKTTLGISFALMTATLLVGVTLAYSSANASNGTAMVVGKNGGIAGNGQNGGYIHGSNGTALNGAPGKDANGASLNSGQ